MIVSRAAERDGHTICAETASIAITRNTAIRTILLEAKEAFFTEETADAEEREGTEEALFFVEKDDAEGAKEADAAHAETHSARALIPDPLPFNEVLFNEFPETANGGADYVWDGQTLTYSPAAVEEPAPVQTADDGSEVSYS